MPEVLFVYPNVAYAVSEIHCTYYYGTGFLRAILEREGISTSQLITSAALSIQELANEIIAQKPRVVCVTTFDTSAFFIERLSNEIRSRNKDLSIFVGGAGATFNADRLHQMIPAIDCSVRGEAEPLIRDLIERTIDRSVKRFSIPGTTWRIGDDFVRNDIPPLDRQAGDGALDSYPSPYLSGVIPSVAAENVGTATSRGCKGVCAYCQFPALFRYQFRTFSISRVTEELGFLAADLRGRRLGPIDIWDDDFAGDPERLTSICKSLIANRISLPLRVELRGDKMNRDLFEMLKEAGIVSVHFGLESANLKTLRRVNRVIAKRKDADDLEPEREYLHSIKRAVDLAKLFGIRTSVSVIIGLPGETMEETHSTMSFVDSLGVDGYQHNIFWALRGTPMWRWADQGKLGLGLTEPDLPHKLETTTYSYDVEAIPRLPNVICHDRRVGLPDALSGLIDDPERWGSRPKYVFINKLDQQPSEDQNRWLAEHASYSTTCFLTGQSMSWDTVKKAMNSAYRQYKSVNVGFHGVRVHTPETATGVLTEERISNTLNVHYAGLHALNCKAGNAVVVVQILTDEDASLAASDSKRLLSGAVLPPVFLNGEAYVEDVCRWSTQALPCRDMARLYVESDSVKQCNNAASLTSSGLIDLVQIRSALGSRHTNTMTQRDCQNCVAKSRCAQCPDLGQISDKVYCRLMREFPLMGTWFALLNNTRRIKRRLKKAGKDATNIRWTTVDSSWDHSSFATPIVRGSSQWGSVLWDPISKQIAVLPRHQIKRLRSLEHDQYSIPFRRQLTNAGVPEHRTEVFVHACASVIKTTAT